jgi:hypothetical protein
VNGIVRRGLKPVPPKTSISLRIDADVLAWFKAQGPGYQKRMNMVLRAFREESRRCEIHKIGTPMDAAFFAEEQRQKTPRIARISRKKIISG